MGNCFGILKPRQGKSRGGLLLLSRLHRLQVVCVVFLWGAVSKSSQHIPSHGYQSHINLPTRKDLLDFKTSFALVDQQVDVMRGLGSFGK